MPGAVRDEDLTNARPTEGAANDPQDSIPGIWDEEIAMTYDADHIGSGNTNGHTNGNGLQGGRLTEGSTTDSEGSIPIRYNDQDGRANNANGINNANGYTNGHTNGNGVQDRPLTEGSTTDSQETIPMVWYYNPSGNSADDNANSNANSNANGNNNGHTNGHANGHANGNGIQGGRLTEGLTSGSEGSILILYDDQGSMLNHTDSSSEGYRGEPEYSDSGLSQEDESEET
ncbi:hypothetical protein BJX76DRAFT_360116 [Aspergillus varians]